MTERIFVVALFCLALGVPAEARKKDSAKPVIDGKLGTKLDKAVTEGGGRGFWGAVLVAKKGKILLAKGYGKADYTETPNTPLTLFELASTSKQFAAVAILHLQQKKKLSVKDTLDKFFKKDVPKDKRGITLHHLLTHTSGISGNIGVPYGSTIKIKKYVRDMLAEPLANEIGETFEYCNVGYALLAAVVEAVTGKTFEEYCHKHLFKPAKLKDTGFINERDLIKKKRAAARKDNEGRFDVYTAAKWHWGWGYKGMGGVVSTVYDMLRWDQALRGKKILNDKSKKLMYEPEKEGYAYGWRVGRNSRGKKKAEHSGSVAGFGCNYVRYLDDDIVVVILSNDGKTAYDVTAALERELF